MSKETETPPIIMKVCIFGASTDVTNLGCRALTASLVGLVKKSTSQVNICLMFGNRSAGTRHIRLNEMESWEVRVVNFRLSLKASAWEHAGWIITACVLYRLVPIGGLRGWLRKRTPWLSAMVEADVVGEIFGGDSFSDIYGLRRFLIGLFGVFTASLIGKRTIFFPQTFGPYGSRLSRYLARHFLKSASHIFSRDKSGLLVVRNLISQSAHLPDVHFCPDVAFTLPSLPPKEIGTVAKVHRGHCEAVIGLNISGLLYRGGYKGDNMFGLQCDYKDLIVSLIRHLLQETEALIVLIPHGGEVSKESDLEACRSVFESDCCEDRTRVRLLEDPLDQHEVKWVIGKCDFFIASRLHACIAALSQSIPTAAIAYSRKFDGVFRTVAAQDAVLDARQLRTNRILADCLRLFRSRVELKECLQSSVPAAIAEVESQFATLFSTEEWRVLRVRYDHSLGAEPLNARGDQESSKRGLGGRLEDHRAKQDRKTWT